MKTLITSGLFVLCCAFVLLFGNGFETGSAIVNLAPTPTPCPSPAIPTNAYSPCNPGKPPNLEEIEKRKKTWEVTKKRLFDATYPLTSETLVDVDGDGKEDKVFYSIKPWKDDFEGMLRITSIQGRTLWEHPFYMGANDLGKFLVEVLDYDSITDWVKNAFNSKQSYAFGARKIKLKNKEIADEQLRYAAKINKFSAPAIRKEILSQRINRVFSYRAEWREDLMLIVYVPSLKRFICYSRGY